MQTLNLRAYCKTHACLQASSTHSVHCYCSTCASTRSKSTLQKAQALKRYYIYSTLQKAYVSNSVQSIYAFAQVNYNNKQYKSVQRNYVNFSTLQHAQAYTQAQCKQVIQNALRYTHTSAQLQLIRA